MKEKLTNNLGLKILSLFLAFFVWLVVVNVSNPEVVRSREVTLEIENEQVLTAAQRTYEISGKNTVTVYFNVRTRDEYKVRATDFRAYIDLAELYDVTGSVQVKVEVLNNKEIISDAAARPGVVRVETEELQSKRFDLAVDTQGSAAEGYALNGVTLTPSYVIVEGPVSQVGLISYVGVEISLDGLNSNTEGAVEPVFYDANGNRLTISDRVTVNVPEIQYQLVINKVKALALDFEVSGAVPAGYRYTGVECDVSSVAVLGLKSSLAALNTVTVPAAELNINGATGDKVVTVDIRKYLPTGIELAESVNPMVNIRLKVEKLANRTLVLTDSDITKKNQNEGLRSRLVPGRIEVTIQGLGEDLESLSGADLNAALDLAGMQEGSHDGKLSFAANDVFTVVSYTDFKVELMQEVGPIEGGPAAAHSSGAAASTAEESGEGAPETAEATKEAAMTTEAAAETSAIN
ncbi:MAG: CdaR family protein [Lachnospiraceae bacterium]|nr:CdaR family protein [Lachnospiraceae bacterium]